MKDLTVTIPYLPSEVIAEILTWLPVITLLKFRCVCKSWQTLISSQQFVKAHLQNSKLDRNFSTHRIIGGSYGKFYRCSLNSLLYESVSERFDLPCPNPFRSKSVQLVGSCNGLVCLRIFQKYLILWNPSTRNWKSLPTAEGKYVEFGFGIDESSGDYKVVGIFYKERRILADMMVQVYSLRNDEWKTIKNFAEPDSGMFGPATFVNGVLYWAVCAKDKVEGSYVLDIVSFDLEKEEDGRLEVPSCVNKGASYAGLGVSGDSVLMLGGHRTRVDVWIMHGCGVGDGKTNWTKLVTIPFTSDFRKPCGMMKAMCVENGRILVVSNAGEGFLVFDAKDCSITYREVRADLQTLDYFNVAIYLESLVSPLG